MKLKLLRGTRAFVACALLVVGCDPGERPVSSDSATTVGTAGTSGTAGTAVRATAPTTLPALAPLPRTDEQVLDEFLEKLAPRAAGIAQVEVVELKEVDHRPGDGNLELELSFRVLRQTGDVAEKIRIVKAYGGLRPAGSLPPKIHGPVKLDTFEKGKRYWVAFSSQYDWQRCPQGVVESWPDLGRPELIARAVDTDHYRDRPQYDPENGLTHGDLPGDDGRSTRVRMERDGALLWEVSVPGVKYGGPGRSSTWRTTHRDRWTSQLKDADGAGWFLMAETAVDLKAGNEYSLEAGKYRIVYILDADTGRTASVRVSRFEVSPLSTAKVIRFYDPKTEAIKREIRSENL